MNYSKVKLTIHAYVGASLRGRPLVTRLGATHGGTPLNFVTSDVLFSRYSVAKPNPYRDR